MHALDKPAGGQLAQVAPYRVLGDAELVDELGGDDLPVALEPGEDPWRRSAVSTCGL